ncbi:hypothetical protein [Nocardioides stalactiti]|uniref:hypothetical protein n=1 Tax=Nocardioides stalactiti TaxID=2755356 RepID=UPI0016007242|nr:hypothetical protein [Nocardioides stalactiti]
MLILREVPRPGVRLSAGIAAVESTTALAVAHTAAGGELPSGGWLLAVAGAVYGASLLVLRGRAPVRVVLPALVGLQVVLHAWLVALTAGGGTHPHAEGTGSVLGLGWPMVLAHVVAGLVAGAVWLLRRRAVDVLLGWHAVAALPVAIRSWCGPRRSSPLPAGRDVIVLPTRGPPPLFGAVA